MAESASRAAREFQVDANQVRVEYVEASNAYSRWVRLLVEDRDNTGIRAMVRESERRKLAASEAYWALPIDERTV